MKSSVVFLIVLLLLSSSLTAQRFGGNRPSVRWYQVNDAHARVIFPKGMDSMARRVAGIAEKLSSTTLPTIGVRQHKINIVLQPYTTVSNAYVALGPFRSEMYLTPPQNSFELGGLPWHDNLAIHEYRHVQQYNNFNVGLSKVFHVLFGEEGQELANALSVPNWFWEGDAVYQETMVSEQGRGRLPFFFDDYRSLWKDKRQYSYMKLRNGSLKDFTPDHYKLGYMMVAYGRMKYGDQFWKNVTQDAASFKGLFYPFQRAVKKYAGVDFTNFTHATVDYFQQSLPSVPRPQKAPVHFSGDQEFPVYANDGGLIYVSSSYKQVPTFVEKYNGRERKIRVRDVSVDNQFSYRNGKIVYASYRPDTRWDWNDYSEIQVLDATTGVQQTITHSSKYFSPDINEAGNTIVAVEVQPGVAPRLHLLNAATGELVKALPNRDNLFYTYPKFVSDTKIISAVRTAAGKMALVLINTENGDDEYVTNPALAVMGFPVVQHDTVYFTAAGKTEDELFALHLPDKKLYRLHNTLPAGIGVYQPAVGNNAISYSSFTSYGLRIQGVNKTDLTWEEVDNTMAPTIMAGIDFSKEKGAAVLNSITASSTAGSNYSKSFHLFNFHSLLPYITDPDYSLSIVGENVLNTMQSELYVGYNRNEQYKQLGLNMTYGGWFPYINIGGNYVFDRRDVVSLPRTLYWNEASVSGGLSVPLNLSKGRSIAYLTIGSDYVYKNVTYTGYYKDSIASQSFGYFNNYISFTHQLQKARQNIYPKLAQSIYFNYRRAIQNVEANQLLLSGSFYWPGLFINHSFVVNVAIQSRDTLNEYRFSNSFPFSRGYESPNLRNLFKWGVNYHFPLAYPDWGVGNIVYFLRIRANAFYDHTIGKVAYTNGMRLNTDFRSAGGEIFFDTKWWNELPISVGFRYSHLLDRDLFGGTGADRFEFILPVNLFQR